MTSLVGKVGGHVTLVSDIPPKEIFQCFIMNPRARIPITRLKKIKETITPFKSKTFKIAHAGYVVAPWSKDEAISAKSIVDIGLSSMICKYLNISYYLIHLPATILDMDEFTAILKKIRDAVEKPIVMVFEIVAAKPTKLDCIGGPPLERLHKVNAAIESIFGKGEYGLCIDTAHVFGLGVPLTTAEDAMTFIKSVDPLPVSVLHFNGNAYTLGRGKDKHGDIAGVTDNIWSSDSSGARVVLKWAIGKNIPVILERHGRSSIEDYIPERVFLQTLLV